MSRNTRRPCYVSIKGLIAAAFESSEPLHLLRLNGHVGAILQRVYRLSDYNYIIYVTVQVILCHILCYNFIPVSAPMSG